MSRRVFHEVDAAFENALAVEHEKDGEDHTGQEGDTAGRSRTQCFGSLTAGEALRNRVDEIGDPFLQLDLAGRSQSRAPDWPRDGAASWRAVMASVTSSTMR